MYLLNIDVFIVIIIMLQNIGNRRVKANSIE